MSTEQNREKVLFNEALELPEAERASYLKGACRGEDELRTRVESLLALHGRAEVILRSGSPASRAPTEPYVMESVGVVVGRYKLLQKIGEGGCGVVYMAEQKEPVQRRVALKLIKVGLDTNQVIARFEAERQALAMMDHPSIAKVLDGGATETGRPYFVMELVRGIKITDYCDQKNLSTGERLALFTQVCRAVQHAHQKGIIHRDLKPSNILITVNDGVPLPKVIDFGIAKATAGQPLTDRTVCTAFDQFIGTPAYMSPEQAEMTSLDIDTRSDIYSLGVLLYELLTGTTPFDVKELMVVGLDAMRRTIREKEPPRPSTRLGALEHQDLSTTAQRRSVDPPKLISLLRGDLDWIVMKCLEKDRTRRYETANGLAADLKRHLDNQPVVARSPSAAYRFQKAWRRNKFVFTGAAVIAVTLIVGIGVSTWQAIEARRARNAEKEQRLAAQAERDRAQAAQKAENRERQRAETREAEVSHHLYVARMNLAQQAWEQNNVGRVRQLLAYTETNAERGFEWYYWQRQTHRELKILIGHNYGVCSVAFSRDGRLIVTGSFDSTAKVWEVASGKELLTLKGQHGTINSAAFSPDGQRIVTGSSDHQAMVWDVASGRELFTLEGHTTSIRSVAFSPDGRWIVTGSGDLNGGGEDHTARIWEAASGHQVLTLKGHSGAIISVTYSPDGQRIVTGSSDWTAKVWEAGTGKELLTLKGHSAMVNSVAFSPDGERIVTASDDHTARVWDLVSGKELLTLKGHTDQVDSVAFAPDGQRIVTGSLDQTVRVWDAAAGGELRRLVGHSSAVNSVAFSPDGRWIATASGDWMRANEHTVRIWDADAPREPLTLTGHTARVTSVSFAPEGERVFTGSSDGTARVWETASGRELLIIKPQSNVVSGGVFSPDGKRIVTESADQSVKVRDVASGRELLTFEGHAGEVRPLAFAPDGQRIATASFDGTAKVWDATTGKDLLTLDGHSGGVWSVAFAPDGRRIVTALHLATKVWDATNGKELLTLKDHKEAGTIVAYTAAFSPDGQRIVTSSSDRTATVWDASSGKELLALKGHQEQVWCAAYSPDGKRIVTGSTDRTAKVWDATTGDELLTLKGHEGYVFPALFSPDGQRIVTGSWDHTSKIWQAATAEQVAAWEEEERAAGQNVVRLQQERTAEEQRQRTARSRDEGAIKRWLVLAPIALATGQSGAEALDIEQIQGEARLRPKVRDETTAANGELKWKEVALEDYMIDFNVVLGRETTQSVAYAVCYIRSEADQPALQMLVGSEAVAKAYLNGKPVYNHPFVRGYFADQDAIPNIVLNAGLNVLVFKVVNETGPWQGSIRFTDPQGNPVKGIKVTLDPEGKGHP